MDCNNVGSMISELYDGEPVSPEAVRHIVKCRSCRERLRDYAAMSAEVRLLAAQEREEMEMSTMAREAMPKKNSFLFALGKTMRVPRFAAAACALVIISLAGGWAHTRAQNTPLWFQYRFSFNSEGGIGTAGAVTQACGPRCEHAITLSESNRVFGLVDVEKIEGGKVYLSLRLKRFDTLPDFRHLAEQMTDVPVTTYVYQPGNVVRVPVTGGGEVEMEGVIVTSQEGIPGWPDHSIRISLDTIMVQQGVLIRDGKVIAEMPGSGGVTALTDKSNVGFYAYVPNHGLFAVGLKPFSGAFQGTANYGQIRFAEYGVKYLLLCGMRITGGEQPRPVWVLHLADYQPSQHDPQANDEQMQFGTSPDITQVLQQMGAIQQ